MGYIEDNLMPGEQVLSGENPLGDFSLPRDTGGDGELACAQLVHNR
jgi:hypothetical protein